MDPLRVGGEEDPANDRACCWAWCFLAGMPPRGIDTSTSCCDESLGARAAPLDAVGAAVSGNAPVANAGVDACDACSACCAAPSGEAVTGTVVAWEDVGVRERSVRVSDVSGVIPGGKGSGAMLALLTTGHVLGRGDS